MRSALKSSRSDAAQHLLSAVLCILLAGPSAFALNPALDISQYAHTSWNIRDGFTKGVINSIAQTPDGYLWLGTEFGLLRFDGVRNVPWQPPPDQQLPSDNIRRLLASRDGTLWIGTAKGLVSWKNGKLTPHAEPDGQSIVRLIEDHEGSVWVGGSAVATSKLCAIHNAVIRCDGGDGRFGSGVFGLYADRKGEIWAGVPNGLWRWKPDPPQFYPMPNNPDGIQGFCQDDDGALLIGSRSGFHRFVNGKMEGYSLSQSAEGSAVFHCLRDREGGLWIGTSTLGLVHIHQGRTDIFARMDGLSADTIGSIFEDREGNIWVATIGGLDRFRDFAIPTFSSNQGLSSSAITSVLAGADGSVWFGTTAGLNHWNHGTTTIYRGRGAPASTGKKPILQGTVRDIANIGLRDKTIGTIFQDARGRIWASTLRDFGYIENDRFVAVSPINADVHSFTGDSRGHMWVANQILGLVHLVRDRVVEQISWASLGHQDTADFLVSDPNRDGLWIGFYLGGVLYFADGQVRASYTAADGLGEGRVAGMHFDSDGTLWVATEGGLSRLKDGRIVTLTTRNGLPCNAVHWAIEDDAHSMWLYMPCGLVRVSRSDLDAWATAVDRDRSAMQTIHTTVFGTSDGVRTRAVVGGYNPRVAKSADGKLWFSSLEGVAVIDPGHLAFNSLPPAVHVEQITADRKTYDIPADLQRPLQLPALVHNVEIDYTGLSLVAPERVLFRYKLEGWDRDWQDVGTRRQAFYDNLPPRNYRFRVIASNNSGVWNETAAYLDFSVAPAYYQTAWFRFLIAAGALTFLAALYRLRLRQVARQFSMRLDERVAERTRIARELHDTLLQSFQGVLLKLHATTYLLEDRPEARQTFEKIIEQARHAVNEGREAVQGMRASTVVTNELVPAISKIAEELTSDHPTDRDCPEFGVLVKGTSRKLAPIVRDEIYRITVEGLRNAFRHAQAKRIEVEICYEDRQVRLKIRDNGKGMDPKVIAGDMPSGHYGLAGMHERAKLAGGKITVRSESGSGTEVELTIPASIAYAKSSATQ